MQPAAFRYNPTDKMSKTDQYKEATDVFDRYAGELLAYVQGKLQDAEESRELLSEVLMKLYRNSEHLPEIDNVRAWLYRITHNTVMDYFREQQRRSEAATPFEEKEVEECIYRSMEKLVPAMVAMLPDEYGQAVEWADLEGVPQKEIADRLGISLSGAKSRVQRGRKKLKYLFTECLWMESDRKGRPVSAAIKPGCRPLRHLIQEKETVPSVDNGACDC